MNQPPPKTAECSSYSGAIEIQRMSHESACRATVSYVDKWFSIVPKLIVWIHVHLES